MLNTRSFHLGKGILPRIMTSITNSCYPKHSMPPPRSCWFTTRLMQAHYNCLHFTWQGFRPKKKKITSIGYVLEKSRIVPFGSKIIIPRHPYIFSHSAGTFPTQPY